MHQKESETVSSDGNIKQKTEYMYNCANLPTNIETNYYDEQTNTNRTINERYDYDSMGNVKKYISPLSRGTAFKYDNNYNMLVSSSSTLSLYFTSCP